MGLTPDGIAVTAAGIYTLDSAAAIVGAANARPYYVDGVPDDTPAWDPRCYRRLFIPDAADGEGDADAAEGAAGDGA